jgi:hypothetical protein
MQMKKEAQKVNEYGSRAGSIGDKLDQMLREGLNTQVATETLKIRPQQIFQHFKKLKDRGYIIERTEPLYKIKKAEEKKALDKRRK